MRDVSFGCPFNPSTESAKPQTTPVILFTLKRNTQTQTKTKSKETKEPNPTNQTPKPNPKPKKQRNIQTVAKTNKVAKLGSTEARHWC